MDPIDRAGTPQVPPTPDQEARLKKLHDAAQGLEGVFVGMLFKQMRAAAPSTSIFGKVTEREKTFNEMLDQARADAVAKQGAFGFAKVIEAQMRNALLAERPAGVTSDTPAVPPAPAAGAPKPPTHVPANAEGAEGP
jgi:Rod binding domain-containing protein